MKLPSEEVFLIYFTPLVSCYTPGKRQETSGFLMFSGGIEGDQWHKMVQFVDNCEIVHIYKDIFSLCIVKS